MLPAILTGLALFQSYVLLDVGRPLWGLVLGHTLETFVFKGLDRLILFGITNHSEEMNDGAHRI